MSVLLGFCESQPGRRLEVGTAPGSESLCELLLVREQDTSDRDQVKLADCLDMARIVINVILRVVWFEVHGTQNLDVSTSCDREIGCNVMD